MRFIITAQASADKKATEQQSHFDAELFKAYMRFNEEMDLTSPPNLRSLQNWR